MTAGSDVMGAVPPESDRVVRYDLSSVGGVWWWWWWGWFLFLVSGSLSSAARDKTETVFGRFCLLSLDNRMKRRRESIC